MLENSKPKLLLQLDIQYFADGGGEPANPPAEPQGGDNPTGGNEPTPTQPNTEPQATYTEEDLNKRIQEELAKVTAKHQEDLAAARTEAEKLAKMNADEKAKYELEKREQALEAKEKEIAARELRAETLKTLADSKYNLPVEVIDIVLAEDAETTNKNIQTFKEVFDKAVQSAVESRLAGKAPQVGNPLSHTDEEEKIREEFAQGLGGLI